ncbi:hypothetical protein PQX77_016294 [Marasmius sp. AFHP31]|nr:hypothetical protein PQX77_016294 [Marasmius sp. AFHP31]
MAGSATHVDEKVSDPERTQPSSTPQDTSNDVEEKATDTFMVDFPEGGLQAWATMAGA